MSSGRQIQRLSNFKKNYQTRKSYGSLVPIFFHIFFGNDCHVIFGNLFDIATERHLETKEIIL